MTIEVSDYGDSVVITQTLNGSKVAVKIDYETAKLVAEYIQLVTTENTRTGLFQISDILPEVKAIFDLEERIRNQGRG